MIILVKGTKKYLSVMERRRFIQNTALGSALLYYKL